MSRFYSCILGAVLAGTLAWSGVALGATTIGNTTIVVKTVTGTLSEGQRDLEYKDDIYHNEVIETFEESATEITFLDETSLSMGPNTQLTLDRFVYDPDPEIGSFVLTITEGALRFATGVLPSASYKIHTPVATIGVRGTVIDIVVERVAGDDGGIETSVNLTVLEGEAIFEDCRGQATRVPEGLSSTVVGTSAGTSTGTTAVCSEASSPGPQPPEFTAILKARDRLLTQ